MKRSNTNFANDTDYLYSFVEGEILALKKSRTECEDEIELASKLWIFIKEDMVTEVDLEFYLFFYYFAQIHKYIFLAITSALKHHAMPSLFFLRNSVEAMTISLYALNNQTEIENIISKTDEKGIFLKENSEKIKSNAYIWLKNNEPIINDRFTNVKMNQLHMGSHIDPTSIFRNTKYEKTELMTSIFDEEDYKYIKYLLWLCCDLMCFYIKYFTDKGAISGIKLSNTTLENIKPKFDEVIKLKEELASDYLVKKSN
jgi:hypothetical protein